MVIIIIVRSYTVGARPGQGYTSSKGHCGQVTVVVKLK